jgi:hypothetical protein
MVGAWKTCGSTDSLARRGFAVAIRRLLVIGRFRTPKRSFGAIGRNAKSCPLGDLARDGPSRNPRRLRERPFDAVSASPVSRECSKVSFQSIAGRCSIATPGSQAKYLNLIIGRGGYTQACATLVYCEVGLSA